MIPSLLVYKASNKKANRKWEELPVDCLVEIFVRVGLVSLVQAITLVCKSWYKTSLNPLCWQSLFFPNVLSLTKQENHERHGACASVRLGFSQSHVAFAKFVIGRSNGSAIVVSFESFSYMRQDVLDCIGEGCPSLKRLVLPLFGLSFGSIELSSAIRKWKDLESLEVGSGFPFGKVIPEISVHCKNFVSISAVCVDICQSDASAIANLLPNIKFLSLHNSRIKRSDLLTFMKWCKKLVQLDVCHCYGFDVDEEIRNLAAHIATVNFEGSKYYDESYDDDALFYQDVDFDNYD